MKKILIISYYWPPAGGSGVQRWLNFSRYLAELGWDITIIAPESPSYPLIDNTIAARAARRRAAIRMAVACAGSSTAMG